MFSDETQSATVIWLRLTAVALGLVAVGMAFAATNSFEREATVASDFERRQTVEGEDYARQFQLRADALMEENADLKVAWRVEKLIEENADLRSRLQQRYQPDE